MAVTKIKTLALPACLFPGTPVFLSPYGPGFELVSYTEAAEG